MGRFENTAISVQTLDCQPAHNDARGGVLSYTGRISSVVQLAAFATKPQSLYTGQLRRAGLVSATSAMTLLADMGNSRERYKPDGRMIAWGSSAVSCNSCAGPDVARGLH